MQVQNTDKCPAQTDEGTPAATGRTRWEYDPAKDPRTAGTSDDAWAYDPAQDPRGHAGAMEVFSGILAGTVAWIVGAIVLSFAALTGDALHRSRWNGYAVYAIALLASAFAVGIAIFAYRGALAGRRRTLVSRRLARLNRARCPHCRYNLRGLPEPRCPECGERLSRREFDRIREREPAPGVK